MTNHPLNEESRVPDVIFKTRVRDESLGGENPFRWQDVTTKEIFAGKKVVVFSLPGAFTPTCSSTHAPGYEQAYEEFKKLGIDEVICVSVNDAFVMYQWSLKLGLNKLRMLPDGNAEFTRKMGMLVKKNNLGFGDRSWRYSMYVEDGVIRKMFIEDGFSDDCPDDPFEVSGAQTMIDYLSNQGE
ncbi:peroxiredoxin [Patescibacteria group bacterium]|nr:peroxiredoxin [Patescibacteria group bacterium]